jgi:hypothetical protein
MRAIRREALVVRRNSTAAKKSKGLKKAKSIENTEEKKLVSKKRIYNHHVRLLSAEPAVVKQSQSARVKQPTSLPIMWIISECAAY